jgi:hypothetical protein
MKRFYKGPFKGLTTIKPTARVTDTYSVWAGVEFVDAVGYALLKGFSDFAVRRMKAIEVDEVGGGKHHGGNLAAL